MSDDNWLDNDRLFVSEKDLARHLNVHQSALTRLAQQGKLPVQPVYVGHRRVYPRQALLALARIARWHSSGRPRPDDFGAWQSVAG